jgi:chemotaxis receptor (MCP) glutamine deamidase CheD
MKRVKNFIEARWKYGSATTHLICLKNFAIKVHHENIGGTNSRTLSLEIGSGRSSIKIFGEGELRV